MSHNSKLDIVLYASITALLYLIYESTILYLLDRTLDNPINAVLFLGIILYIIISKIKVLTEKTFVPDKVSGTILILTALLLLFILDRIGISDKVYFLLNGISLLVCVFGLILLLFGRQYGKVFIVPVLFFAIPFRILEFPLESISYFFQETAAVIAHYIFSALGMTSNQFETIIELSYITLSVDKSCNGVNHIIALIALALFLISLKQKSSRQISVLLLTAFVLGVVMNGIRVALIGIWAYFFDGDYLHGPANLFYVTFVFTMGAIGLIALSHWMDSRSAKQENPQTSFAVPTQSKDLAQAKIWAVGVLLGGYVLLWVF